MDHSAWHILIFSAVVLGRAAAQPSANPDPYQPDTPGESHASTDYA
jgi:hypothetical protein